jgi:hypothetical protein
MYTYKGKNYEIHSEGKMKDRVSREWIDCVFYTSSTGETYARERREFYELFKLVEKAPYHIQAIAKLYPILVSDGNIATGEIRKFRFVESQRGTHSIGNRVVATENYGRHHYDAIWVHVGNDYFKMIGLWEETRTC